MCIFPEGVVSGCISMEAWLSDVHPPSVSPRRVTSEQTSSYIGSLAYKNGTEVSPIKVQPNPLHVYTVVNSIDFSYAYVQGSVIGLQPLRI